MLNEKMSMTVWKSAMIGCSLMYEDKDEVQRKLCDTAGKGHAIRAGVTAQTMTIRCRLFGTLQIVKRSFALV